MLCWCFCCCFKLRPYCFVVLFITLIFHSYEFVVVEDTERPRWTLCISMYHSFTVASVVYALYGVILRKRDGLLTYIIVGMCGFIPIIIDGIMVINDEKIFMFDTSVIERAYGSKAVRPIVGLILMLIFVLKCDFNVVVYEYYKELLLDSTSSFLTSSTSLESSECTSVSSISSASSTETMKSANAESANPANV